MPEQNYPLIVRNTSKTYVDLLGLLRNFFHEKRVTSCTVIVNTTGSEFAATYKGRVEKGLMFVKGENGRIFLSRRSDFGITYIIKPNDQVCIEHNRLTFADNGAVSIIFVEEERP